MIIVHFAGRGKYEVRFTGGNRFDMLVAEEAGKMLKELVLNAGSRVYFNLGNVRFIDTKAFGELTEVHKLAVCNGSVFTLCNVRTEVMELFDLTGLTGVLKLAKRHFSAEVC